MSVRKVAIICLILFLSTSIFDGCKISYSFTGASIAPTTKTVSVAYFQNQAPLVYPTLSQTFTEGLKDAITRQTSLNMIDREGDVTFEGNITDYAIAPQAVQGNEQVTLNRLTITVQVKFTNAKDSKQNFEQSFTRYADYATSSSFQSVQDQLITQIVKDLCDDIFNKAFVNW